MKPHKPGTTHYTVRAGPGITSDDPPPEPVLPNPIKDRDTGPRPPTEEPAPAIKDPLPVPGEKRSRDKRSQSL